MPVKKGRKKVVAPDKEWAEMKRYMKEHNLTQQAFVQRMWDALKQSESNKQPYEIAHEEYKKAIDKVLDICSGSVDRQVVKYHFDIAWAVFMQIYRKKIDGIRFTDFISSALNDPRFGYHAEKPIVDQEAIVKKLRESQKQKQKEET